MQSSRFNQFKEQHNELKNILKLFDLPKSEASPQTIPFSPARTRKMDRNAEIKSIIPQFDCIKT